MTAFALSLVLLAAVLHALWNLAAKRSGGGMPFIFLAGLLINLLYVPVLAIYGWLWRPEVQPGMLLPILVSTLLKTGYAVYLQRSYRTGDFSLVYPLARGTGPLLATLAAVLLLGERPTWLGAGGGLLIVVSIFLLTGGDRWWRTRRAGAVSGKPSLAIRNGLMTGAFIASYTVWDRHAVSTLGLPPVLFDAGTAFGMTFLLAPFAWRQRAAVWQEWHRHRREALVMAVLSPLGYVLVLTAMSFTPVSYIAPAREFSILIGAYLGARMFREQEAPRRTWAAFGMVAGLVALALA